jgi:hypothetical protein
VTVTEGTAIQGNTLTEYFMVTASNFLPDAALTYTCSGAATGTYSGQETDSSGDASFQAECRGSEQAGSGTFTETITVSDGTNEASGSVNFTLG